MRFIIKEGLIRAAVVLLVALFTTAAFAHSGGTDRYGCHHDRQNGGYHCH